MSLFNGDLIIKTAIELILEDVRKNPWIIEDIFSDLLENPILAKKYGMAEISRAKEFISSNNVAVYMKGRIDKQEFPCITIALGESSEDKTLATLGDLDIDTQDYTPDEIDKPIQYMVPPFTPVSYNSTTGIIEVPTDVASYIYINQGMIAVDPATGNGWIINGKAGVNGFQIAAGSMLTGTKIGVVPQYQLYRAKRERIISQESYNIGCHVEGDQSTLIFLFGVIKYGLLRYREALLEHNNFQLSTISCTDMVRNDAFGIDNVFSRFITLSGQVEESWIKTPMRIIESVVNQGSGLEKGIVILSNLDSPPSYDTEDDAWVTIEDDGE